MINGHAEYSPSSMDRLIKCPWSFFISRGMKELPKLSATKEGSFAHDIAERITEAFLLNKEAKIPMDIPTEIKEHGIGYAEFICDRVDEVSHLPHKYYIEERFVANKERDFWGTPDFVLVHTDENHKLQVSIIDYKYGKYRVEASHNWQLASYLYAIWAELGDFEKATAYIYQPKLSSPDEIYEVTFKNRWEISLEELKENFFKPIDEVIHMEEDEAKKRVSGGSHCFFCKAKHVCISSEYNYADVIMDMFNSHATVLAKKELAFKASQKKGSRKVYKPSALDIKEASILSDSEIEFIYKNAGKIIDFIEGVKNIPRFLLENGEKFEGYKLVEATQKRSLIEDEVLLECELLKLGIKKPYELKKKWITIGELDKKAPGKFDHLLDTSKPPMYKVVKSTHKDPEVTFTNKTKDINDIFKNRGREVVDNNTNKNKQE